MDEGLLGTLQTYVLPHWPFVMMSFALGTMGQFFKKKVWTFERAKTNKFWEIMYLTLGIHAPLMGAFLGALGAPASPGMDTWLERALYHFGSGAMASWTFAAWAHFMRSRGIVLAESMAPPPNLIAPDGSPLKSEPPTLPPLAKSSSVCPVVIGNGLHQEWCGRAMPCPIHSVQDAPVPPPPLGHDK